MFRALTCPSSGVQIVFTQLLVSSLSVNGCTVHRLRADLQVFPVDTMFFESNIEDKNCLDVFIKNTQLILKQNVSF